MSTTTSVIPPTVSISAHIKHLIADKDMSDATIDTYERTAHALGFDEVGTDAQSLEDVWARMTAKYELGELSYGFCRNGIALIKTTLKHYGVKPQALHNYNVLLDKLNKGKPPSKKAYTDSDVYYMLHELKLSPSFSSKNAFCACLLMSASACRIGSTKGVKFSDFEDVGVEGVLVFPAIGKRRQYTACVAKSACDVLRRNSVGGDYVVRVDPHALTRYDNAIRLHLRNRMNSENNLGIFAGRSALHSFRKWALGKMAMSGLSTEDIARLAGHATQSYNQVTARHYLEPNTYTLEWKRYLAETYKKTKLATLDWTVETQWT